MTPQHFSGLLNKWRSGQMNLAETRDFMSAIKCGEFDELLQDVMLLDYESKWFEKNTIEALKAKDWELLEEQMHKRKTTAPVHRVHFLRTAWFRVAVIILLFSSVGAYLWLNNTKLKVETAAVKAVPEKNDVMPGTDKAILTLSDGRKVELKNSRETINDGNLAIKNNYGQLIYASLPIPSYGGVAPGGANSNLNPSGPGAGVGRGETMYNTMTTPRGGTYQLILPDGSRVWLNAESSITFPTAFTNNTREIKITGEAYFEIKPNAAKPFIVKTISDEIQVLGTSFNVNSYKDAPVKTSLLEGKVKVNTTLLKPGEAMRAGKIINTNIDQDLAWKNGRFAFNDTEIFEVMRQFERWYDITVRYEGQVQKGKINGRISRNLPLSQVLTIVKKLGYTTELKGKELIISQ